MALIAIKNIEKLLSKLGNVSKLDLSESMRTNSLMMQATAQRLVRVDTGSLRNSIMPSSTKQTAIISTDVEYAVYQEFGTAKMKGKEYMRPALSLNALAMTRMTMANARRKLAEEASK